MFATDPAETQEPASTASDFNKSPVASPTFPTVQRRPKNLSRLDIPKSLSSLGNREPSTFEPSPDLPKPSDIQETIPPKSKPVNHFETNTPSTILISPRKSHPGIHPSPPFEGFSAFYTKGFADSNFEHSTGSTLPHHTFQSLSATPNVIVESGLLANFAKSAAGSQESNTRFKNDFIEEESLGKGSFGEVTKCMNKMDKNYYAVKKMTRRFQGEGKYYTQGEMKAMALIQNTDDNVNIVRYFQSWVEGGKSYLVMEYCPSTLSNQVKETGRLNESELKKVVRDVSLGLNFLHKNDIVHLDIKTANILISESGIYKLGDMGCAKRLNEAGVSDGDDRYLAPEALSTSKEQQDEKKFDIYSLGVMLFELATNCSITKNGETYKNVKGGDLHQLDSVTHLSESFKDLIRLMLDHDPKKRPTAQEILDKYVLSQEQIDLKWEKIARKALEIEKADLEKQYQSLQNRRKSVS